MENRILVYEKNRDVITFLKSFFHERQQYAVHFFKKGRRSLAEEVATIRPGVLIVGSPNGLNEVNPSEIPYPIIAIISKDQTKGIQSVMKRMSSAT